MPSFKKRAFFYINIMKYEILNFNPEFNFCFYNIEFYKSRTQRTPRAILSGKFSISTLLDSIRIL